MVPGERSSLQVSIPVCENRGLNHQTSPCFIT
jgi:hypothetical protein